MLKLNVKQMKIEYNSVESRKLYLKLIELGYNCEWRGIGSTKDFLFYKDKVFGKIQL